MKCYKKSKLTYKNGYLMTKKGKVVPVDNKVVDLANKLERDYQYAMWKKSCNAAPSLVDLFDREEFEQKSERVKAKEVVAKTPLLDSKVNESIKLMKELDTVETADKCNQYLAGIALLVQFAADDEFVSDDSRAMFGGQLQFDLPTLGNPLDWTVELITEKVTELFAIVEQDDE